MWLEMQTGELAKGWLSCTSTPMLATLPDGTILWANQSFCELIGYTQVELYANNDDDGISWMELTVDRGDLRHDKQMAQRVMDGVIEEYQLTKQYKHKAGNLIDVTVHVHRWPKNGVFECFLVSIYPLGKDVDAALHEVQNLSKELRGHKEKIEEIYKIVTGETFGKIILNYARNNPKLTYIALGVLSVLLFGSRVTEIVQDIQSLFGLSVELE